VSWLEAGYETDCVTDTYKEKCIIFVKKKLKLALNIRRELPIMFIITILSGLEAIDYEI